MNILFYNFDFDNDAYFPVDNLTFLTYIAQNIFYELIL